MQTRDIKTQNDALIFLSELQNLINEYFDQELKKENHFYPKPNFHFFLKVNDKKFVLGCKSGCTLRIPSEAQKEFHSTGQTIEETVGILANLFSNYIVPNIIYVEYYNKKDMAINCTLSVIDNKIIPGNPKISLLRRGCDMDEG